MIRINSSRPSPPLGKYPQLRLWGQVGSAPIRSNTRMTIRMVDMEPRLVGMGFYISAARCFPIAAPRQAGP